VELRIGLGVDVHRFAGGRPLVLGGVSIEHDKGLAGHSDADVLTHAVMDAVLGAMRAGDIGEHFPDTDAEWAGVSSMELLAIVLRYMDDGGFRLVDLDTVVVAQEPRIAPHRDEIRRSLARGLRVDVSRVGVKATTTEGLGFTGRSEGIMAQATVLLERVGA
jgi:2-C-methyl-D-erythritol 2,4-cyclodiphosphate synthase